MARQTIASRKIDSMTAKGYEYIGMTQGWVSNRKGSNLRQFLDNHNLTWDEVEIECGAKRQHATEGTQILVFRKARMTA